MLNGVSHFSRFAFCFVSHRLELLDSIDSLSVIKFYLFVIMFKSLIIWNKGEEEDEKLTS
jgi:hypothetical protein